MNTLLHTRLANDPAHSGDGNNFSNSRSATGDKYQSLKLFARLLWKEYRQLRPIWIALASIVLIISCLMALRIIIQHSAITGNLILFVPCLCSLSAGALFFANEKEQGTDRWLSQWTVPALSSFIAKYLVAFIGVCLLVSFATAIAYLFNLPFGVPENSESSPLLLAMAAIAGSYVFTSTASVIFGRVLPSAVIGGTMTLTMIFFAGQILSGSHIPPMVDSLSSAVMAASPIVFLTLLTFCFIITPLLLARRLSGRSVLLSNEWNIKSPSSVHQSFHDWNAPPLTTALLWKEFRQSRLWLLGLLAFTAYILSGVLLFGWANKNTPFAAGVSAVYLSDGWYEGRPVERLFLFLVSIFMGVAGFCGLLTFMNDQAGRSFRFLAHQGLRPRRLWMVKQTFYFSIVLVWIGLLLFSSFKNEINLSYLWAPWALLTGYATFQLSILLIPQTIVAFAVGFCCCAMLLYYSLAMTLLDVPFLFIVAVPMPIGLLLSSLSISRSWMEEDSGWKSSWKKFGVIVGPLAMMFVIACLFRAFEIPATPAKELIPAHLPPATTDELATANAYAKLFKRAASLNDAELKRYSDPWRPVDYDSDLHVNYSDDLIAELIEITKRPVGTFSRLTPGIEHDWIELRNERIEFELLATMLFNGAKDFERKGEWNNAKELYLSIFRMMDHAYHRAHYVLRDELSQSTKSAWRGLFRWAKQPNTTVKQITDIFEQLKRKTVVSPLFLEEWYLADQDIYSSEYPYNFSKELVESTYFLSPWERVRAKRLKSYQHAYHLKELDSFINSPDRTMAQPSQARVWGVDEYPWYRWERNTPTDYRYVDYGWYPEQAARENLAALSAIAWMKKYGDLPDALSNPCKEFLGERPVDSWNGMPFQIVRLGNRFQIVEANDQKWESELKAKHADPRYEEWGFSWHPGEGYSTDPNGK